MQKKLFTLLLAIMTSIGTMFAAQLWPILMDTETFENYSSYVVSDLRTNGVDNNMYIWPSGDTYIVNNGSDENFFGNDEGYVALTVVAPQGWAGGAFNISASASITAISTLNNSILANPSEYYLHFAIKSSDNGSHFFQILDVPGTKFSLGTKSIYDAPIYSDFDRDGAWHDFYIPMTQFVNSLSSPLNNSSNINIFTFMSEGVRGIILNLDAIFFCDQEMKDMITPPKIGDLYYKLNNSEETAEVIRGDYKSLSTIDIPTTVTYNDRTYSVTSIGEEAFSGCNNLTSVAIPSSVTSIAATAFYNCSGLTSIVWNAKHCADFTSTSTPFYYSRTKITSFIFGNEVEYIPAYLCYNMINAEVVVPNCNVEIGEDAFANCKLVKMNKLPDFSVTAKHEYDTPNSGSISINNPYNYEGTYFYTLNGSENASLKNMTAGEYRLVFYGEECGDSIVKNINIYQYGMKVNGMYYLLDENNHTATLTYRGASYDDYSSEYSGNITIPKTITFDENEYQVIGINSYAFSGCNNITSITMELETPIFMYSSGLSNHSVIYVPFGSLNTYKSASEWNNYTIHVINPSHATATTGATSATITLGNTNEAQHIASCGMEGGAEEFAGNVIEYIGLEPNSEYANIPLFIKTIEGDVDNTTASFTTTALELTTKASKPVSATTAILLAETNMSDAEVSCGFEYKRNDAPADMEGNKVFCPVASGQMAGRLKNLKDDVYYKYRAFYQSAAGNMYYGDWQYIFTGDVAVEFDPILYTYGATVVRENEATICGYALAGSEDFTEQGFEYWAESRVDVQGDNVQGTKVAPRRMPAALNEHFFVQASGIALRATLTDLDAGTVYKYRVYGKVGDQYYYGAELTFTTKGVYEEESPTSIEEVPSDQEPCTKLLHNGQIFILRGDKTYTITGQKVK